MSFILYATNLFGDVQDFCGANSILVPNMDEVIPVRARSRREGGTVTNLHHYRAEIFYVAIDKFVWRWITALVKEQIVCLIVHVLTPRTLSRSSI